MTEQELRRRMPNASESFIKRNAVPYEKDLSTDVALPDAKPECGIGGGPLAEGEGEKESASHFLVRFTVSRQRLTDDDNAYCKPVCDCLRYAGILPDDRPQICKIISWQKKVDRKDQEQVLIEVFEVTDSEWEWLRNAEQWAMVEDMTKDYA